MTRDEAYGIVTGLIKNHNLIKHHLAAESAMKGIAAFLKDKTGDQSINIEDWGLVGLLHDADYEICKGHPEKHTLILEEKIGNQLPPHILYAIKSHAYKYNERGVEPKSLMDWAIYTCDELTGFIIATALVKPDKKLSSVDTDSVLRKMKDPSFARAVDRGQIQLCEDKLQIPLRVYVEIVLSSMKGISNELGL